VIATKFGSGKKIHWWCLGDREVPGRQERLFLSTVSVHCCLLRPLVSAQSCHQQTCIRGRCPLSHCTAWAWKPSFC